MDTKLKQKIVKLGSKKQKDEKKPKLIKKFRLKTARKNQLLAFLKPEVFLDKSEAQIEKIIDLTLGKFEEYGVTVDGAAIFPGPTLEKYSIMDKHYGVINHLSKNASKALTEAEKKEVFKTLGISKKDIKILGGHEAFLFSGVGSTQEFDQMWLETPSTKIRSGFYVRPMVLKKETVIVVNGFHPHQLAHYTAAGRKLGVLLVSSDTSWARLRDEMLGSTFPEKANPKSIRGTMYKKAKTYGFASVRIENNIMHLSAGPTEAMFEIDNFLKKSLGVDIFGDNSRLANLLLAAGLKKKEVIALLTDKEVHSELEHKDTGEAIEIIKAKLKK